MRGIKDRLEQKRDLLVQNEDNLRLVEQQGNPTGTLESACEALRGEIRGIEENERVCKTIHKEVRHSRTIEPPTWIH